MLGAHEKFLRKVKRMMSNLDAKLTLLDALKDETEELVNMLIRAHGGGRSHGRTIPDGR